MKSLITPENESKSCESRLRRGVGVAHTKYVDGFQGKMIVPANMKIIDENYDH